MKKYVEVTKLLVGRPDEDNIEVGKKYELVDATLSGVYIYVNRAHPKYFLFNEQFNYVEQKEEEKEMKKYAKITKYSGLFDKENGLEIGKEYEIVKFISVSENCFVYLNDKHPSYLILEDQYELVEKEEKPTFKTTIELKSIIQAKIDELSTEAEHLFKKRNRLEQQAINLNKKVRKLNEVIESIKEFE